MAKTVDWITISIPRETALAIRLAVEKTAEQLGPTLSIDGKQISGIDPNLMALKDILRG